MATGMRSTKQRTEGPVKEGGVERETVVDLDAKRLLELGCI